MSPSTSSSACRASLVRYGVAPDHPRIKEIVKALQRVLAKPEVRFLGNVEYGVDVKLEDLREFYDAVVVATGAMSDRALGIPGEDLPGSFGAADFVSWYDAHPDVPRTWPLEAEHVAVLASATWHSTWHVSWPRRPRRCWPPTSRRTSMKDF